MGEVKLNPNYFLSGKFKQANSPKISFNSDSFGFEDKIKPFIQAVIDECYEFVANGKSMTPEEYMKNIARLNPDNYTDFMSSMKYPYYTKTEFEVADNWWHSKEYHNIPLDNFMNIIKTVVKKGYTIAIGGDVSESGYVPLSDVAIVPAYDIPSEYIDENARQFRFCNRATTDDHAIHLLGYLEKDGKWWFLVKDSGSSSRNGNNFGYFFYHEDYVKLKMMTFTIHKDAVKDILKKFE